MRSRSLNIYVMAPTSRKAARPAKLGKHEVGPKMSWEEKVYFLWLHFQMKDGDKVFRTLLNLQKKIIPGSHGLFQL